MNVESLSSSSNVNVTCTPPTTHCRPKRTKRSPDENDSQEPTPKRQRSMSKKNITDCRDPLFSFVSDAGNDGCGLKNLGNSCFINAFVQCFANEDILVTRLLDYTQAHVKDDRTMAQFTTRNYSQDARQYDFMFKWISSFAQAVFIVNKNGSAYSICGVMKLCQDKLLALQLSGALQASFEKFKKYWKRILFQLLQLPCAKTLLMKSMSTMQKK
eukprot:7918_1